MTHVRASFCFARRTHEEGSPMQLPSTRSSALFPLRLNPAQVIEDLDGLVRLIVDETDEQLARKDVEEEANEDFAMSCDALNFWRVYWRCGVEAESDSLKEYGPLIDALCEVREY